MIILHASICDHQFFLWGETSPDAAAPLPKKRGRPPKIPIPQPFPYDPGAAELAAAFKTAGIDLKVAEKDLEEVIAWLPTKAKTPLPSSPLIAESPNSRARDKLVPWRLAALPLSTEQVIDVLCLCAGRELLAPGVVLGKDMVFWSTTLRFAGALVVRQRFLPDMERRADVYRACWKPVFTGEDTPRLHQLARALPAAGRALSHSTTVPPESAALALLSGFIGEIVDGLVRLAAGPIDTRPRKGKRRRRSRFDSLHDQWLHALRAPDGSMKGRKTNLDELADQIRQWQQPLETTLSTPFRLSFRLKEPAGNARQAPWTLEYLLQGTEDPSLLIPVKGSWRPRGGRATLFKKKQFTPREYLLATLGQAAGLCPPVEHSMRTAQPAECALDVHQALRFLDAEAASLEQAGFGVLLPAWWTRKGTKLRLSARAEVRTPKMTGGNGMSLDHIVQFDWKVALGDEPISVKELEALARLKVPLVKVRGQWVQVDAAEIQTALDFWRNNATGKARVREIVQMALGAEKTPGPLHFEGVAASGWIDALLKQLEGRSKLELIAPPAGFCGRLRPYQHRGYAWLHFLRRWGLGACLADDMGLGKTIQALALIQQHWENGERRPVLLICPTSVLNNWHKEADRFTPDLPVLIHHGVKRKKGAAFKRAAKAQAIVVSSYALLQRDIAAIQGIDWAGVILDEAQNIKNPETKQARAARSLRADYRVALTGTPVENNVGDLWSLMEFLNPDFLGTQAEFKHRFFIPIQAERNAESTHRLQRLTGPFILRRLKTDKKIIRDLPEKLEMKVFCNLSREQASLYTAVVQEIEEELEAAEGIQRRGLVLAALSKLKQVCNHPAQFLGDNSSISGRSGKLARLSEMLEEALAAGDHALVFTQFAEMGTILQRHLQEEFGREVLFLHGRVSRRQRDRMVEKFQSSDGPPLFVLSLKAGGTGLNLTRANHVFHFDRWWNPAVEDQATDRAFRIGQTRNVQVHKFLCAGTLEERIDAMIERKKEVAEQVVGTGEAWLTELSNNELKELFALRREAIGEGA